MKPTKRHPKGYWGPRVMMLIRARQWNTIQTAAEFGIGWDAILRIIKGGSPSPRLVRQLLKLEALYADDIEVTHAAIEYRAKRITPEAYSEALRKWVDASNRKIRPDDIAAVGVVGAEGTREGSRFLQLVQAPTRRRVKRAVDPTVESGRPDDSDGGSDGASEGAAAKA